MKNYRINKIVEGICKGSGTEDSYYKESLEEALIKKGFVEIAVFDEEELKRIKDNLDSIPGVEMEYGNSYGSVLNGMPLGPNYTFEKIGPDYDVVVYVDGSKKYLWIDTGNWRKDGKRMKDLAIKIPRNIDENGLLDKIKRFYAKSVGIDIVELPQGFPVWSREIDKEQYETYDIKYDYEEDKE